MFCPQCGKQIPDGSSFCQFCGCKLQDTSPVQNTMNAPGRPAGMGSTADASTDRQRYAEAASTKKNGSFKKWLPIFLFIILTLLIAACVFIYKKRDGQVLIQEKQAEQEQQQDNQQISSYEHHIGDAVFYTEHDLRKYIIPDPDYPGFSLFDIETMLRDVWGDVGLFQDSDGYSGTDESSFTHSVSYNYADGRDDAPSHQDVSTYCITVSGTGGGQQCGTVVTIHDEKLPPGGWLIVKGDTFGFSPDSAALLLYVLEQTESNPRSNIASELSLPSNYECKSF